MVDTTQVRVERSAIAAWKRVLGIKIADGAATSAALAVAADIQQRELEAKASGMHWLLGWLQDGHADPAALMAGDVEIKVLTGKLHVRIGGAQFFVLTNPSMPSTAVKLANEAAK